MSKQEFIEKLRVKLSNLPQKEVDDRIAFYSEMIDDKIEDGILEEDAVKSIGDVDDITSQIITEIPLSKIVKEKLKINRKLEFWEIALMILCAPILISVIVGLFVVIFSIYISLWSVVVSLWAGFVSLCVGAVYGILVGGALMIFGDTFVNFVIFSLGILAAGLAIFLYFGCKYTTKGMVYITKKLIYLIKIAFAKKEATNA
ncbi:MAG: DUF1700 domain-containing protein [Clostridia bacterium]|nr:DUF1700 domain-containing protein [Clostridia bacterium]